MRISQPQYRKYFYFISGGNERVGVLLTEVLDTDKTYGILDPQRKVRTDGWKPAPGEPTVINLVDWSGLAPEGLREAWLDYCYYYGATKAERQARYGSAFSDISLFTGHSRLTAWHANQTNNATVAQRAWKEFYNNTDGHDGLPLNAPWKKSWVNGSIVLAALEEATWIQSSNAVAQYGLAVIQDLALARQALDSSLFG